MSCRGGDQGQALAGADRARPRRAPPAPPRSAGDSAESLTETPWPVSGPGAAGCLAHRGDRRRRRPLVALGVGVGARALAQHVEGAERSPRPRRPRQRRLDGAAEHELLAHDADGGGHRAADHRLAQPAGQAAQMKPGRSRCAPARPTSTSRPVSIRPQVEALTNRLSDWPRWLAQSAEPIFSAISRSRVRLVGRAQQRLGQAHQRQALAACDERELLQEALHHALLAGWARAARTRASASARTAVRRRRSGAGGRAARAGPGSRRGTCRRRAHPRRSGSGTAGHRAPWGSLRQAGF